MQLRFTLFVLFMGEPHCWHLMLAANSEISMTRPVFETESVDAPKPQQSPSLNKLRDITGIHHTHRRLARLLSGEFSYFGFRELK
jgi:hypothetical protein